MRVAAHRPPEMLNYRKGFHHSKTHLLGNPMLRGLNNFHKNTNCDIMVA